MKEKKKKIGCYYTEIKTYRGETYDQYNPPSKGESQINGPRIYDGTLAVCKTILIKTEPVMFDDDEVSAIISAGVEVLTNSIHFFAQDCLSILLVTGEWL
jgi:hypothetical protein